jgi:hypothetical protein
MISKWLSTARRRRWRCSRARSSRRLTNGCRCCLRVRRIARVGTRTVMGAPLRPIAHRWGRTRIIDSKSL